MPRRPHKTSARAPARREPAVPQGEQGLRLDAARAEFRAAWKVKVDRKRRQAARLRGVAEAIHSQLRGDVRNVFLVGGGLGAALFGVVFVRLVWWPFRLFVILVGFMVGYVTALALTLVALELAQLCQRWAKRCEQSADRMEPTRRRRSR